MVSLGTFSKETVSLSMLIQSNLLAQPNYYIREIPVYGDLILAPMLGYSDSPDRIIARRFGSALSYSEFVNAIDILGNFSSIEKRLTYHEAERPVVFQIFDNDPSRIIAAAKLIFQLNPDILDINLGCSAKKVSNRGAGAGLLRTPDLIKDIFSELVKISPIPVTAKIRLGWDDSSLNYLDIARLLEDNGASLIAVHGRTKIQAYSGLSDWQAIAEIKQTVHIPVIANGDVKSLEDIDKIKLITDCDGVMIGRGSIGNPWIFSRIDHNLLSLEETKQVILDHLRLMTDFYGPDWGHVIFRKHLKAYLRPYSISTQSIRLLMTSNSYEELKTNIINTREEN
jgi:tRNA-dihydrouridine synthase B